MSRILVVDDDYDILRYCESVLSEAGHEVVVSSEPQKAFDTLSSHAVDLLILDILMPLMSGYDFLRTLKHFYNFQSPILMFSRKRAAEDVLEALKYGASDYLCKPLDRDLFLGKVDSILGKLALSPAVSFAEGATYTQASVSFPACVTSVTEMGMTLKLNTSVQKDFMIAISSPLFHEIGLAAPPLRVVSCAALPNDSHYTHRIYVSFIGLNEVAMQKIRRWITRQSGTLRKSS